MFRSLSLHSQHNITAIHSNLTGINMGKDHPDADLYPEATGLAAGVVKVSALLLVQAHNC